MFDIADLWLQWKEVERILKNKFTFANIVIELN